MRKRRRSEEFRARIFRLPSERQQGRQDIASVLAFVARVAATAGAFAYCGWIAAGDVAAGILGIAVFAVLIASSRGSLLGSVSHHGMTCIRKEMEPPCWNSNNHGRRLMQNLSFRTVAFAISMLTAAAIGGSGAIAAGAAGDISGTWWVTKYDAKLQIVGGGPLPLTAAGKEAYQKNRAGLRDGSIVDAARKFCVPDGIPRVLANPYPFEIIQAPPGQITIIYELNHQIRTIAMDKKLPTYEELIPYPFYNGHSVGRWEGDTLVVETAGFNEKTFLDAAGAPHTDALKITERWRKISPTQLENIATISDPMYYTRDFQVRFLYNLRNEVRLEDYVCGEPHRDISKVPGVRIPPVVPADDPTFK